MSEPLLITTYIMQTATAIIGGAAFVLILASVRAHNYRLAAINAALFAANASLFAFQILIRQMLH